MWVGMENIIINFHCNQMSTKNVIQLCVTKQLFAPTFFESLVA